MGNIKIIKYKRKITFYVNFWNRFKRFPRKNVVKW